MRINKYIASCGVASRRKSEQFILAGKVKINGEVVENLATEVNESTDVVELDGKILSLEEKKVYYILNKPKGYICTRFDKKGRKTIYDLIQGKISERVFSVGRLDYDTEGLLILTNDGDLSNLLTHPKNEIEKTYVAKISGELSKEKIKQFQQGLTFDDGFKTAPAKLEVLEKEKTGLTKTEVKIHEGKNRQVRRMFEQIGCQVEFLKRTQFAFLKLGALKRGELKELSKEDVKKLKSL